MSINISPLPCFAFLQLIVNDRDEAIDYMFMDVSYGFLKMLGLNRNNIIGKKASEVFPNIKRHFDWIGYFQNVAVSNIIHEITGYAEALSKECNVIAVPSGKRNIALIIREVQDDFITYPCGNEKINLLLSVLCEQSIETTEHTSRVEEYCRKLGTHFRFTSKEMKELSLLAVLHDIGKIGINPAILKKPAPLTNDEWIEMKRHPEIGWRIVRKFTDLTSVSEYILYHHERWDGKGYPSGLKADQIPLPSRILAVADAYDAMTSDRVYRKRMMKEDAIEELKANAGTQFDPLVVDCFVKSIIA